MKINKTIKKAGLIGATALLLSSSMAQAQEKEYYFVIPGVQLASAEPTEPEPELPYGYADNGITVQCEGMADGDTFELNGVNYTVATSADATIHGANACTSNITNMSNLFMNATTIPDITSWDTSKVTNMDNLFGNTSFNQDISNWNVSSLTNASGMFAMSLFNQNISSWDVSSLTNADGMFQDATEFNQNISNWDVSSLTGAYGMFSYALKFNQDLSGWCVQYLPTKPGEFDEMYGASDVWTLPRPVWGTCPTP